MDKEKVNRIDEESRVEIEKKELCNLEEEKVMPITYKVNEMTLKELEEVSKEAIKAEKEEIMKELEMASLESNCYDNDSIFSNKSYQDSNPYIDVCEQDDKYNLIKNNAKKREGEVGSSKDTAAVIEDRMMKLQQENKVLINEVMDLQKEIYRSTEMMETIKEKV